MAVALTERARAAVEHRRARGRASSIALRVAPVRRGGHTLAVEWAKQPERDAALVAQPTESGPVYVDRRIVPYTRWHTLPVSAERVGPIEYLVLENPIALLDIAEWNRSHPGLSLGASAPEHLTCG